MRKLGLVGSLLVVSAGWHALGACTGDEPVAGVLDAGTKDGALPEAAPPGEGGVGSPKLAASVPRAMLRQGGTVEIALNDGGTRTLTTRSIVIAAGARPLVPPLPGLDSVDYVTSDTLWEDFARRDSLPGRIVVLGGGPIGCELSQAFARLGADVSQVEMAPRILAREDEEVSAFARQALEARLRALALVRRVAASVRTPSF